MAAVSINITTTDEKGKSATTRFHVISGFSLAQYNGFALAAGQLIANLQNGSITEIGVSIPIDVTLGGTINALADLAEKAWFGLKNAASSLYSKLMFPTFNSAFTIDGSDALDEADADVAAFISILENGVLVSAEQVDVMDMRGNTIDTVTYARELFRNQG